MSNFTSVDTRNNAEDELRSIRLKKAFSQYNDLLIKAGNIMETEENESDNESANDSSEVKIEEILNHVPKNLGMSFGGLEKLDIVVEDSKSKERLGLFQLGKAEPMMLSEEEKSDIIINLQNEVDRLKLKLNTAITKAEETIAQLYSSNNEREEYFAQREDDLVTENLKLNHENKALKNQIRHLEHQLDSNKGSLLKATNNLRRLYYRKEVIGNGISLRMQSSRSPKKSTGTPTGTATNSPVRRKNR